MRCANQTELNSKMLRKDWISFRRQLRKKLTIELLKRTPKLTKQKKLWTSCNLDSTRRWTLALNAKSSFAKKLMTASTTFKRRLTMNELTNLWNWAHSATTRTHNWKSSTSTLKSSRGKQWQNLCVCEKRSKRKWITASTLKTKSLTVYPSRSRLSRILWKLSEKQSAEKERKIDKQKMPNKRIKDPILAVSKTLF